MAAPELWSPPGRAISDDDLLAVEALVRQKCCGVLGVASRCPCGHPEVIQYYPLSRAADGRVSGPFPTLFWLVCPEVARQVSRLESEGWVGKLEAQLAGDPGLLEALRADHGSYQEERWGVLSAEDRELIRRRGWSDELPCHQVSSQLRQVEVSEGTEYCLIEASIGAERFVDQCSERARGVELGGTGDQAVP